MQLDGEGERANLPVHPLEMRSKVNDCKQDHSIEMFEALFMSIVRFPYLSSFTTLLVMNILHDLDLIFRLGQDPM